MKNSQKTGIDKVLPRTKDKPGQPSNATRGRSAAGALGVFCKGQGFSLEDAMGGDGLALHEAIRNLMINLGHLADACGLDYRQIAAGSIGNWYVERIDPETMKIVDVTITIGKPY